MRSLLNLLRTGNYDKQWRLRWNAALCAISSESALIAETKMIFRERNTCTIFFFEIITVNISIYTMNHSKFCWKFTLKKLKVLTDLSLIESSSVQCTGHLTIRPTGQQSRGFQLTTYKHSYVWMEYNYGKCSKILNTFLFLFLNKTLVYWTEWNLQNACQKNKQGRPWSDCFFRSSLIWVCAVYLDLCSLRKCSKF